MKIVAWNVLRFRIILALRTSPVHRNMITVYPLQNTSPLKEALASCVGGMTYISWGAHSEN